MMFHCENEQDPCIDSWKFERANKKIKNKK